MPILVEDKKIKSKQRTTHCLTSGGPPLKLGTLQHLKHLFGGFEVFSSAKMRPIGFEGLFEVREIGVHGFADA